MTQSPAREVLHILTVADSAATLKLMWPPPTPSVPALLALVLGTLLASCTPRPGASSATVEAADSWRLTVVNHHWLDMSIVVLFGEQRSHVGTVSATQTQSFDLPARWISSGRLIRLEAN